MSDKNENLQEEKCSKSGMLPVMFEDDTNIHLHAEDLHTSQNKTA